MSNLNKTSLSLAVVFIALLVVGCSSSLEDIQSALAVCESNGGLNEYRVNKSVKCVNGAIFECPGCSK